jgi:hypothetical protein
MFNRKKLFVLDNQVLKISIENNYQREKWFTEINKK